MPTPLSPIEVFTEPYPCMNCPYWDKCRTERLSCESFHIYVAERGRLDRTKRHPTREQYIKTFLRKGGQEAPPLARKKKIRPEAPGEVRSIIMIGGTK